ncbi:MAG TPA: type II/IV secretion system protein [Candidatus Doudnabacteria bacterium]|nr:type II/IV secretion system protein [Candidatus Doudnabacteria bacterium]
MGSFLSNNPAELTRALDDQKRQIEETQAQHTASLYHLPYLNMQNFPLDLNSLALVPEEQAKASESVPFFKEGRELKIATINPNNQLLDEIKKQLSLKYKLSLYFVSKSSFNNTLSFYSKVVIPSSKFEELITVQPTGGYQQKLSTIDGSQMSATEALTIIFGAALEQQSSDIHFEPEDHMLKIRYRVDGVLHDAVSIKKVWQKTLVSRLKLMAKLKLNIENESQDGRIAIMNDKQQVDVRVSVLPSSFGEAVVMRLLGVGAVDASVNELGLFGKALEVIEGQLHKANGMIITTGPTGSGKTTTLYAFLKELNQPGVKIITLEDPVEYKVEGIQQTPIDHRVDFSFVKALRAVLRQDPDVVMVGEIRDPETAETALQAALTGHVVLSTLHTNDAAGAVPRLLTMGVKPFIIAPAINAIIAQRLVRRLCTKCREKTQLDEPTLAKIKSILADIPPASGVEVPKDLIFYSSKGCEACGGLGYKGRIGIYEIIEVTDKMRELILNEPSGLAIKKLAAEQGSLTMIQDGTLKALQKITDIHEVFRVAG